MASGEYYLGVDVGTGSARVCLVDQGGEIVAIQSKDILTFNSKADYYEQSTEDIWSAICECTKGVLKSANIKPESVKGIGFDATCSLAVLSAEHDEPISVAGPDFSDHKKNVILWMDHRPVKETEKINATGHKLLKYVGGSMSIEMEIPKVLWLKNNMPPSLFAKSKFYDLADALTHIATGKETRSFCSTVCKQGYVPVGVDGSVKGWQEDFLTEIGLGELAEAGFKRIGGVQGESGSYLSAGELVGELCEKSARELGLVPGIKIGSGVIDAYAGWIGTVGAKLEDERDEAIEAKDEGNDYSQAFHRLAAVAGTSTCHLVMSKDAVFVPGIWGPYRDVLIEGYWMAEGGQSCTGALLNHIVTTHPAYQNALKDAADKNIYQFLNERLEALQKTENAPSISYLARHIFLQGDYHGNRSPVADPNMRGSFVGLSMDTSIDNLALQFYAAMEFVALQTRHIIDSLNESGHSVKSIFMSGGQCRNPILMALIANVTNMPVLIPKYITDAVVLGAAMLGAKAASADAEGKTENLWSIMTRMSKPGTLVHPTENEMERKLLDTKYKILMDMTKAQQRYRESVNSALASLNL